ncbi:MAG TPA: sigma-54 dependent transcriptional regulator [Syntrophobacter fumaroxidans]|nr:sigma-54 dependent transcriptional regulator [Syntrophobacter fumaroxidans]
MASVFVIEDDHRWRACLKEALRPAHSVVFTSENTTGYDLLAREAHEAVIINLEAISSNGIERLKELRRVLPYTPLIVTSPLGATEFIVEAVKAGAVDFVPKPYSGTRIKLAVDKALENRSLRDEIDYLRRQQDIIYDFDGIIAASASMKHAMSTIRKLAHSDSVVLMTGETGTGKSILSGAIHFNSARRRKPFVKINCANIPEALLESELFGHEKGAFTSANKTRVGRLEQANGGSVFLDEIGELSLALQAKFLRVLEEKAFERLGGNQTIHSDIRIIAATNKNLDELVTNGAFREDLYYRINVLRVHLPPLRNRRECIEPLSYHLLGKICRTARKRIEGFLPDVIALFKDYQWPGNIRELSNTIERSVFLEENRVIHAENVFLPLPARRSDRTDSTLKELTLREKEMILEALEACHWTQKDAASMLGITPRMLNYKVRKYGITHPRWRRNR